MTVGKQIVNKRKHALSISQFICSVAKAQFVPFLAFSSSFLNLRKQLTFSLRFNQYNQTMFA